MFFVQAYTRNATVTGQRLVCSNTAAVSVLRYDVSTNKSLLRYSDVSIEKVGLQQLKTVLAALSSLTAEPDAAAKAFSFAARTAVTGGTGGIVTIAMPAFQNDTESPLAVVAAELSIAALQDALRPVATGMPTPWRCHLFSLRGPGVGTVILTSLSGTLNETASLSDFEGDSFSARVLTEVTGMTSSGNPSVFFFDGSTTPSLMNGDSSELRQDNAYRRPARLVVTVRKLGPSSSFGLVTITEVRGCGATSGELMQQAVPGVNDQHFLVLPTLPLCGTGTCWSGPIFYHRTDHWTPAGTFLVDGAPLTPTFQASPRVRLCVRGSSADISGIQPLVEVRRHDRRHGILCGGDLFGISHELGCRPEYSAGGWND